VCTANAIRSPFLEHLLRVRFTASGVTDTLIDSAGSAARPGDPAAPQVIEIGRAYGLDLDLHRTRRLGEAMLRDTTLVLCAAGAHRRTILDMRPDLLDSTFTMREFARLLDEGPREIGERDDWPSVVRAAAQRRTRVRPASAEDDDLVDPIGQPPAVWERFERDAVAAVETITAHAARVLRGGAGRPLTTTPATRRELRARRTPITVDGEPSAQRLLTGRDHSGDDFGGAPWGRLSRR
jgi:protein-tyrosine phosphatase